MNRLKRNLMVTLADRNFLAQAKQLFSSVYWNAGWTGDYMLLADGIPADELRWFREKGILTREAAPLFSGDVANGGLRYPATVTSKMNLFSLDFKRWESVVFVDADCIVRYPLDALTKTRYFSASRDWLISAALLFQTDRPATMSPAEFAQKFASFDLFASAFNTGLFAFKTAILDENTLPDLENICHKYKELAKYADQLWMNLYFYRRWSALPLEYNLFASYLETKRGLAHKDIDAVVLHFPRCGPDDTGMRCWDRDNAFHGEWKANLDRADLIDLHHIPRIAQKWPRAKHLFFGMWRIRAALWRDYVSFFRSKLNLRTRARRMLFALKHHSAKAA